jgi:predicted ATPase
MIKKVKFLNFKSMPEYPITLNNLNVLIGKNASGKSNFVDGLKFIHDILKNGLGDSVGRRFGWENALTREKGKSERIKLYLNFNFDDEESKKYAIRFANKKVHEPIKLDYSIEVSCVGKRFYIEEEKLASVFMEKGNEQKESFTRTRKKVTCSSFMNPKSSRTINIPPQRQDTLFIHGGYYCLGSILLDGIISSWRFYAIDVNSARQPSFESTRDILSDNGHNLAQVLDSLNSSYAQDVRLIRDRIVNLMKILIPGFSSWQTQRQADGSLGYVIIEDKIKKGLFPKMISDGTIRILGILLALLYHPKKPSLICVDEPERCLHPQVLKSIVELIRDVSKNTQVIVTTHSTELVRWLEASEVLMVSKENTSTRVFRAESISMIDKFLEELSMDELWLGDYLKRDNEL